MIIEVTERLDNTITVRRFYSDKQNLCDVLYDYPKEEKSEIVKVNVLETPDLIQTIHTYFRKQSLNTSEEPKSVQEYVELYNTDKQFREIVDRNHPIEEYEDWKHIQRVLGTVLSYKSAMRICTTLEEEGLEIPNIPVQNTAKVKKLCCGGVTWLHESEIEQDQFGEVVVCPSCGGIGRIERID